MKTVSIDEAREREARISAIELRDLARPELDALEALMRERIRSSAPLIPELSEYMIFSGGKQLRALITILCAKMSNYSGKEHIRLAAAVEFLHNATLLHDDVVDEGDMRRGRATARGIWGNPASVLVGDFLLGRAFEMMVASGSMEALRVLSRAAALIAEGEVMQLAILGDVEAGEEQYFRVIETKTATLFSAAASVGGIVANCNAREVESLRVYGHNLGIAFQLVDDALDYGGESARLGKWVGNDFLQGKVTLPILLAFSRGNDDEKNFWRDKLAAQQRGTEDLSTAMSLVEKHDVLPKVLEKAKEYGTIAHDSLASFEGKYADALRGAVRFATDRKH
ncbi:MAG: polyprenyl synthetase family protein [Hyphomicrobiales bacterium]|nr:polyprenyl synthetase family protein [Hyphomicrobiales bacterium]MCY4049343.1 polyprenyl synthetase family protein [Hyphomicrobiales bacterium]MCY4053507.1 polyprenyl synthetase family protein [Hyphomicrobiales bacterium]